MRKRQLQLFITLSSLTFTLFLATQFIENRLDQHIVSPIVMNSTKQVMAKELETNNTIKNQLTTEDNTTETPSTLENPTELIQNEIEKTYVYLTFDDGPTKYTEEILNILQLENIKASFFLLQGNAEKFSTLVTKMSNDGHTVGCHGISHRIELFYKSTESPLNEMSSCAETVEQYSSNSIKWIRTPFGSYPHLTVSQKELLTQAGYTIWDWNVDSKDWYDTEPEKLVMEVVNQVKVLQTRNVRPVILLHDKNNTVEALPKIIQHMRKLGYEFRPITEEVEPLQFKLQDEKQP